MRTLVSLLILDNKKDFLKVFLNISLLAPHDGLELLQSEVLQMRHWDAALSCCCSV